ncbi:catalase, partial [Anaerovorax odorimutans]|uniref:catalase n=1 Tax=Anaerovorax odorimutans TaxID=109327 RepID=UPI0003F644D6
MKLDMQLIEELADFNREKTPERVICAKGTGAHGIFKLYMPMGDYTKANFLQDIEKEIPVFVRFSTALGSKGTADTNRDFRGFATRFYTEEGNYDLLCSSMPVFFIRDPNKIVKLIHSLKPSYDTNLINREDFWNFISENPETIQMLLWLFSDKGTVKSYRHMEGFSVNTYLWISKTGDTYFVRYHWIPMSGIKCITRQESEFLAGFDPDVATRDLYEYFERGEEVSYELAVQLIKAKDKYKYDFDILDVTKIWSEKLAPSVKIGKMILNKPPTNYKKEVEEIAFNPLNTVPGIELSADKMLNMMSFAFTDAQRHRLGSLSDNHIGRISRESEKLSVLAIDTKEINYKVDDFTQAGDFYRSLKDMEKNHLIENILDNIMFVEDNIQEKVVGYLSKADEELGAIVAMGLNF